MYCDYHLHTIYSDDSEYLMENVVQDAVAIGLEEICFSDHVDYGVKLDWNQLCDEVSEDMFLNVNYPQYFNEIAYLQKKYENKITIKRGLEFGMQKSTIPEFQKLYDHYPLDFVILSIHQVDNKEFWNGKFQKDKSEYEYYDAYFQEMYFLVQHFHNYSVLGHMDMLKRYDDKDGYDPFKENYDIIKKILMCVIEDGKGIELNTSSFKYKLNDLMPSRNILKLYYELGGTVLTIGSDSHAKDDLENSHIKELKQELKAIGFERFCTFEHMKVKFHTL